MKSPMSTASLHTRLVQKWSKPEPDLSLTPLPLVASLEGSAARILAPQLSPQPLQPSSSQDLSGLILKSGSWRGAAETWTEPDPKLAVPLLSHEPQAPPVWKGKLHGLPIKTLNMGYAGPRTHLSPVNYGLGITDSKGQHWKKMGIQRTSQHLPWHHVHWSQAGRASDMQCVPTLDTGGSLASNTHEGGMAPSILQEGRRKWRTPMFTLKNTGQRSLQKHEYPHSDIRHPGKT